MRQNYKNKCNRRSLNGRIADYARKKRIKLSKYSKSNTYITEIITEIGKVIKKLTIAHFILH